MSKVPTVRVSYEAVDSIFKALDIIGKIDRDELTTEMPPADTRNAHICDGGHSFILKHYRHDGTHVATTHLIRCPDGSEPHRHGKDVLLGEFKFTAFEEPPRE